MRRLALAVLGALLWAPCAPAQPATSARAATNADVIEACLQRHRPNCAGSVANDCLEANDPSGSARWMTICTEREVIAWGVVIERAADQLRSLESADKVALLERALVQGEAADEPQCDYEASEEGGLVEIAALTHAECLQQVASQRGTRLWLRVERLQSLPQGEAAIDKAPQRP